MSELFGKIHITVILHRIASTEPRSHMINPLLTQVIRLLHNFGRANLLSCLASEYGPRIISHTNTENLSTSDELAQEPS